MFQSELLKIPEARQILPKQRQFALKAYQLSTDINFAFFHKNIPLKKLPQSVEDASFNPLQKKSILCQNFSIEKPLEIASLNSSPNKSSPTKEIPGKCESRQYANLQQKYQLNRKMATVNSYQLVYERRVSSNNKFDFAYQFVKQHFVQLDPCQFEEVQQTQQQTFNLDIKHKLSISQPVDELIKEQAIQFDSHFESGNLEKVYRKLKSCDEQLEEYHLWMQNDTNTQGYNQWYFFRIKNNQDQYHKVIRIRIVNFNKPQQLYQRNLRPWILRDYQWTTLSDPVKFQKTQVINPFTLNNYYELSFELKIQTKVTYLSLLPPYTYSRLCKFLKPFLSNQERKYYQKKTDFVLSQANKYRLDVQYIHSLLNNTIPILVFSPQEKQICLNSKQKLSEIKNVIIIGRHHPGQVWSSYLLEKLISQISSEKIKNQNLQGVKNKSFSSSFKLRFIIIPMINPDGVIYGNFRTDYTGFDLNRVWLNTDKYLHPSVYSVKKVIHKYIQNKNPKDNFFFDIHSHSRNYGIFNYMCHKDTIQAQNYAKYICQLLSKGQLGKNHRPIFDNEKCSFMSQSQILITDKKATARAYFAKYSQISATIQISFDGYLQGKNLNKFDNADFQSFSITLKQAIEQFFSKRASQSNQVKQTQIRKKMRSKIKLNASKDSNSDSQPQQFYTKNQVGSINQLRKKGRLKITSLLEQGNKQIPKQSSIISQFKLKQYKEKNFVSQFIQKREDLVVNKNIRIKNFQGNYTHSKRQQSKKRFRIQTEQQQLTESWKFQQENRATEIKQNIDRIINKKTNICVINVSSQLINQFPQNSEGKNCKLLKRVIPNKSFIAFSNYSPKIGNQQANNSKNIKGYLDSHLLNPSPNDKISIFKSWKQKELLSQSVMNQPSKKQSSLIERQIQIKTFQKQKKLYQKLKNRQKLLTQVSQSSCNFKQKLLRHRKMHSNSETNQKCEKVGRPLLEKPKNPSLHKFRYF